MLSLFTASLTLRAVFAVLPIVLEVVGLVVEDFGSIFGALDGMTDARP